MKKISIIIPTLNEAENIVALLELLQDYRQRGHEVIVVDGGSDDDTVPLCNDLVDQLIKSTSGRAQQMNKGAKHANGDILLFLHADTVLPKHADQIIINALNNRQWGRFNVKLSGRHWMFPVISFFINLRSRISGIATGDQAIFITQRCFKQINGFPNTPLMEDIALSKTLRCLQHPVCLHQCVITSSRRWTKNGIWRTILLMWRIRFAYWLGADPAKLANRYQ